jgi:hypothetical protein
MTEEEDSDLRNYVLNEIYGTLPSYCYFTATDIMKESISQRIDWYVSLKTESHNLKDKTVEMIDIICEKLQNLE